MLALVAVLMIYGTFAPASTLGAYTMTSDGQSIVRMDTRTGAMERCTVAGTVMTCKEIVAQQ